jgi:hypothetical protein
MMKKVLIMPDSEIIKDLPWYLTVAKKCGSVTLGKEEMVGLCDLINRQKSELEKKDTEIDILIRKKEALKDEIAEKDAEIDRQDVQIMRLKHEIERLQKENEELGKAIGNAYELNCFLEATRKCVRTEAYRYFADKITEVFTRYAHIHQYAEEARRDYIEAVDGTNIEMQSVWDVFTLKKNGMAEYEEMGRLQNNIERISTERLLTKLEKDFQLLVNELTRNLHDACTESNE